MPKLKLLLLMTMSLMLGCQSTADPADTSCHWTRPITTTAADRQVMSRETKQQIATHNDLYDLICGE